MEFKAPEGWIVVKTPCQNNPDLWFSDNPSVQHQATKVCSTCIFKEPCLRTAEENKEIHGIWGGKNFEGKKWKKEKTPGICRKGLHKLPDGITQCPECRKLTRQAWEKKNPGRTNNQHKYRKPRQKLGDVCKNGHELTEKTSWIRSSDKAVVCKVCTYANRVGQKATTGFVMNQNMGSRSGWNGIR